MIHYGDITKLSGYTLPAVDVITGGSPCQDLSIAGGRAGLEGERSGLFLEQIRIVKELREHDRRTGRSGVLVRPRYMVWENVPGAFSSNKGADFQTVLTEIIKVAEPESPNVPMPDKNRWSKSGCLYDAMGRWSIAWRLHDSQFWGTTKYIDGRMFASGTPQRRKRISLIADFGGLSAPEILFERKGLSGDFEESREKRERTSSRAEASIGDASYGIDQQGGKGGANYSKDVCPPILSDSHGTPHAVAYGFGNAISFQERAGKPGGGKGILIQDERIGTLSTLRNQAVCYNTSENFYEAYQHHGWRESNVSGALTVCQNNTVRGDTPLVVETNASTGDKSVRTYSLQRSDERKESDLSHTLSARDYKDATDLVVESNAMNSSVVRRLTPDECAALQGFPRDWCNIGDWYDSNGKLHKDADSPKYKAYGNSIALPFWQYLARRICAQYERSITIGSLFDGIGGFPLVFQRCGAIPVWASEIEEFPIAVTKYHFNNFKENEA